MGGFFKENAAQNSYILWAALGLQRGQSLHFQSGVIPEKSSHCSPLQPTLTQQFLSGGISSKVLPLHCSPFQPTLTLKSLPIAAHCSPLLHGNFSQGGNSLKILPLQPIAAHSYMAISVRGVIPQKSSHCSPTLTSFYPL